VVVLVRLLPEGECLPQCGLGCGRVAGQQLDGRGALGEEHPHPPGTHPLDELGPGGCVELPCPVELTGHGVQPGQLGEHARVCRAVHARPALAPGDRVGDGDRSLHGGHREQPPAGHALTDIGGCVGVLEALAQVVFGRR
jgi:hypothetical protein